MDPLGHRLLRRARFYGSLKASLDAGLPVDQALSGAVDGSALGVSDVLPEVLAGKPLSAGLRRGHSFPRREVSILEAGERSGRLPASLGRLSDHLSDRAEAQRRLALQLAYPVVLIHAAVLLPILPKLVTQGVGAYLGAAAQGLTILYVIVGALAFVLSRPALGPHLLSIPVLGTWRRSREVADYCFVLGSLVGAGAPIVDALRSAATAVYEPNLRAAGLRIATAVRGGSSLGESFGHESRWLGTVIAQLVQVGETAGKLEGNLEKAEELARQEASQAQKMMIVGAGLAAFFVAALVIGWTIVSFWSGYAETLGQAVDG